MKLVAGLGNPGESYSRTRHNIGFMVVSALAKRLNVNFGTSKFKSTLGTAMMSGEKVLLAKPQTYMNRSGEALQAAMAYYKLSNEDIVVVYDDKDLEYGRMKITPKGSDGGHRGIRSIIQHLNTQDFTRVRMGIGQPEHNEDVADFVLKPFYNYQIKSLEEWVSIGADAVEVTLRDGPTKASNRYNRKLWTQTT